MSHTIVIFGASGDLTSRKLVPALYNLKRNGLLPADTRIVGFSRTPMTDDEWRATLRESTAKHAEGAPLDDASWREFAKTIHYQPGDIGRSEDFQGLADRLHTLEGAAETTRVYYLATAPQFYEPVVAALGSHGMAIETNGPRRIVVEKPFGTDLATARALNEHLHSVFHERQVFRIDHYLGKESVQNILALRFANTIFEPVWNRRYIDHVQITVAESIGVEGRGAFYEETGALRDILQNHLLQLLTLVAMEPPANLEADALRDEKVKVLRAIRPIPVEKVDQSVVRGQYGPGWVGATEATGYRSEPAVDPESETETFVAARLEIDDWRWAGVPFYLRAGKRLPKRATEIAIQFKDVPQRLFPTVGDEPEPNLLVIRIQPDEGILMRFAAKVPGLGIDVRPVNMDFAYGSAFTVESPDAYETLILDALLGDASLFTRADEVEAAWRIVDPIIDAWIAGAEPEMPNYTSGTWGPEAADELLTREGRRWRRL